MGGGETQFIRMKLSGREQAMQTNIQETLTCVLGAQSLAGSLSGALGGAGLGLDFEDSASGRDLSSRK